jgi:hypothetical protein
MIDVAFVIISNDYSKSKRIVTERGKGKSAADRREGGREGTKWEGMMHGDCREFAIGDGWKGEELSRNRKIQWTC